MILFFTLYKFKKIVLVSFPRQILKLKTFLLNKNFNQKINKKGPYIFGNTVIKYRADN